MNKARNPYGSGNTAIFLCIKTDCKSEKFYVLDINFPQSIKRI